MPILTDWNCLGNAIPADVTSGYEPVRTAFGKMTIAVGMCFKEARTQREIKRTQWLQLPRRELYKIFEAPAECGKTNPIAKAVLVLDATGADRPIHDAVRAAKINAAQIVGLSITSGANDGNGTHVTKKNLTRLCLRPTSHEDL